MDQAMFLAAAAQNYSPEQLPDVGWFALIIAVVIPASIPVGMGFLGGAVRLDLLIAVAAQCGIMGWALTGLFKRLQAHGISGGAIFVSLIPAYLILCLVTNILFLGVLYLLHFYR
jgi:hypothetical protein